MMKVFEPTTVEGQPAVYTAAHLPRTGCDLKVGIAPNQGLDLSYSGKDSTVDWCGQVIEIAKIMVRRIRDAPPIPSPTPTR